MDQRFYELLQESPIIAAVRSDEDLAAAVEADVRVAFVLYGDVCSVPDIVARLKTAGKAVLVHVDLVVGLAAGDVAVDFMRRNTEADGIITTRAKLIHRAKELGLWTVLRAFVIDSAALDTLISSGSCRPDAVDILPGLMPTVIRKVREETGLPVLTGGLITEKKEVLQALDAGALAISTTHRAVWQM